MLKKQHLGCIFACPVSLLKVPKVVLTVGFDLFDKTFFFAKSIFGNDRQRPIF